jgi:hypothetical protein
VVRRFFCPNAKLPRPGGSLTIEHEADCSYETRLPQVWLEQYPSVHAGRVFRPLSTPVFSFAGAMQELPQPVLPLLMARLSSSRGPDHLKHCGAVGRMLS